MLQESKCSALLKPRSSCSFIYGGREGGEGGGGTTVARAKKPEEEVLYTLNVALEAGANYDAMSHGQA